MGRKNGPVGLKGRLPFVRNDTEHIDLTAGKEGVDKDKFTGGKS